MGDFGDTKKLRLAVIENAASTILDGSREKDVGCNNFKYTNEALSVIILNWSTVTQKYSWCKRGKMDD